MTKATKKKKPAGLPGSIIKKTKAPSSKKSNEGTPKKARQKGNGAGVKTGKSTDARPALRTPDHKQRKSHSLHSTPSTVTSNSTSSSKRAVSMMISLAIKSPPKKMTSV